MEPFISPLMVTMFTFVIIIMYAFVALGQRIYAEENPSDVITTDGLIIPLKEYIRSFILTLLWYDLIFMDLFHENSQLETLVLVILGFRLGLAFGHFVLLKLGDMIIEEDDLEKETKMIQEQYKTEYKKEISTNTAKVIYRSLKNIRLGKSFITFTTMLVLAKCVIYVV